MMTTTNTKTYSKRQAREAVQTRLNLLSDEEYLVSACAVCRNVSALLADLRGKGRLQSVLSYRASPKWREVDLSSLEQEFPDVRFDHVPVNAKAPFPATSYDAVLVPLYGFNVEGYRLGHGSGWYDRFLTTQPKAYKIGVGLEVNRATFAADSHDIPMDAVITESRVGLLRATEDTLISID